ncbi:MAG: phosphate/phosphite/phosphonate ABC transporter substrate-binding protein [Planctomycetes bacterium]|nr:phosphate/phosphite/phosphonate ABC transporter substrate-binding protein [Planctomycetota bacterium]
MMRTTVPLFAASLFLFAGCSSEAAAVPQPKELHFSVLPDFNKATLAESAKALEALLTKKLGVPVHYEPSTDYAMCVNSLISNKVDFVWLGGKTTVDAIDAGKGAVHVIATRDIDLHFKTYFIANQKAIEAGHIKTLASLKDLAPIAKDLTFTFGDKNSTSGHLMPRFFLTEAGINPDLSFKGDAGYQASGGHSSTLKAVASGAADLGALNYSYYDGAKPEEKTAAPIVFTTPEYVDYAWVGHNRIGEPMMKKINEAFTKLDAAVPEEKAILDAWKCKKFETAKNEQWESIRKVRDSLPKGFLQ